MTSESDSKCSTTVEAIETAISEKIKTMTIAEVVQEYKNEMECSDTVSDSASEDEEADRLTCPERRKGINCKCKCHNCFPECRENCIYEECSKIPLKWCGCFSDECRKRIRNCESCLDKFADRRNKALVRGHWGIFGVDYDDLEDIEEDEWRGPEDPKVTLTTCECKKCGGKGSDTKCVLKVIIIDPNDFSAENNRKLQNPAVVKHVRSTRIIAVPYLKSYKKLYNVVITTK
jgi:hypothetical protein